MPANPAVGNHVWDQLVQLEHPKRSHEHRAKAAKQKGICVVKSQSLALLRRDTSV